MGRTRKKTAAVLIALALLVSLFPFLAFESYDTVEAADSEIVASTARITYVDASVQLPYNYASIIGFKITITLLKDNTMTYTDYPDDYCGYGGDNESGGKYPCYILDIFQGEWDSDTLNPDAYGVETEGANYEKILVDELSDAEIIKFGVGSGYYVAGYLDNGRAISSGANMTVGDQITISYQGTTALFPQEDNNTIMTCYGYTSEFTVDAIEWITGTPVVTEEEDWDTVEKTTIADVSTVEDEDNQNGSNYVNIIVPAEGEGPFPVILWIHGGAWTSSSRTDIILSNTMEYMLAQGFAFVSAEYTLSESGDDGITNETQGKQMIYDLKLAVRFLRANAETYNLNTDFIGAMGESAGAHLALLLGTTNGSDEHEAADTETMDWKDYSSDVQAMAAFSGPTDLTSDSASFLQDYTEDYPLLETTYTQEAIEMSNAMMAMCVLGQDYISEHTVDGEPDDELLEAEKFMSPYWQVNSDTPAMYLIHGEADTSVPISNAYAMELMSKMFMDEDDVLTAYYAEATHVDKSYFDIYAQYYSTTQFMLEQAEEAMSESEETDGDDDTETKSGCGSVLAVSGGIVCGAVLIAAAAFVLRKRPASK